MEGKRRSRFGPGAVIAAAFVGPGTVTTCTLAGANAHTALLWALVFSVLATFVLQEMTVRLGLFAKQGLAEAIRRRFPDGPMRAVSVILVVGAVGLGCAAYEAGNLLGAGIGLSALGPGWEQWSVPLVLVPSGLFLLLGGYGRLELLLLGAVGVMALVFTATALGVSPPVGEIVSGALIPRIPRGQETLLIALVGTTVVPYNLFLHSALIRKRFPQGAADLRAARNDAAIFIGLGGLASAGIVLTAAGTLAGKNLDIKSGADLAMALEPALGSWARTLFGMGLFAAGISSAVTAPMAAGYAVSGILGGNPRIARIVMFAVFAIGALFLILKVHPIPAILLAQALNGLSLPFVALFLLVVMNDRSLLGDSSNSKTANVLGVAVTLVTLALGGRWFWLAITRAFGS